jgi:hypothetical protein
MAVEIVFPAVDADVKVMFGGFQLEERQAKIDGAMWLAGPGWLSQNPASLGIDTATTPCP